MSIYDNHTKNLGESNKFLKYAHKERSLISYFEIISQLFKFQIESVIFALINRKCSFNMHHYLIEKNLFGSSK